ncbi:SelT/SelW/SelH family protein [Endozoicomonas sp.]|uniref:SelT/SelW/SelH family protein n=1 Tax=Endozoicomonas sp. TaxID=1892382 RepID=UPI00383A468A
MTEKPIIVIEYCSQCQWLLRSAWLAQELLSTFSTDIGELRLKPGTGGIFIIKVNGKEIWERKKNGGFPQPREIKQKVRDIIAPEKDLGHNDR